MHLDGLLARFGIVRLSPSPGSELAASSKSSLGVPLEPDIRPGGDDNQPAAIEAGLDAELDKLN